MLNDYDFNYNGLPIFNVGFSDFNLFVTCLENGNRLLAKNIQSTKLQEYYKKSRNKKFGICYEGVIVDLVKLKEQDIDRKNI